MQTLNNPAARLHALLTLLCRMPEGNPARNCFGAALGVNTDDNYRLIQRLSEMVRLADRAEEQLRALPNVNLDLYLSWKPQVQKAFGGITLLGQIGAFIEPLKLENSLAIERLGYCADLLSRECGEKEVESSELEQIRRDLEALRKEVRDSDIDGELKLFMLYQLGFILDAINQCNLFGLSPVESATNEAVGALLLNAEARKRLSGTTMGEKFWSLLRHLHLIVAVARDAGQLFEAVKNLLP